VVDELKVVATTLAEGGRPPEHLGVDHWSSRVLGKQLGISFASVARIWRKWGIQPRQVETFTLAAQPSLEAQVRSIVGPYLTPSERRAGAPHRPALDPGVGARPADPPDPWLNLVEVSLAIITQQAIRRGTYASVHHLIEAIGALTDGWRDRHEPSGRAGAHEAIVAERDREVTFHTPDELRQRSSRVVESGPVQGSDRSVGRSRDSMSVRAEFHGARGRRSGPRKRVSD
jgi:hypothetical protein